MNHPLGGRVISYGGRIIRLPFMFSESEEKTPWREQPPKSNDSNGQKPFEVLHNHRTKKGGKRHRRTENHSFPMEIPSASRNGNDDYGESPFVSMSSSRRRGRHDAKGKQYSQASKNKREIRTRFAVPKEPDQDEREAQLWRKLWMPEIEHFRSNGLNDLADVFTWAVEQKPQQPELPFQPEEQRQMIAPAETPQEESGVRAPQPLPIPPEAERNELLADILEYGELRFQYQFQSYNNPNQESHDFFFGGLGPPSHQQG